MYFDFSKEQYMGRDSARAFLGERLSTTRLRALMATETGFDRGLWSGLAELGWTSVLVPEEHGGLGLGFLDVALLLEESGRALLPAPLVETAVVASTVLGAGDRAIRERWLPAIASGDVVATVALGGADGLPLPAGLGMRARRDGGALVLDGEALVVPFGPVADLVLAAAIVDGDDDVVVALVEADAAGIRWQPHAGLDPTFRTSALRLDAVRVGPDRVIAGGLDRLLTAARAAVALQAVGGASRPLEMSVEYAKVRQQFGRPIGTFQAIKHRCADMLVAYETTRAGAYYAAWAVDTGAADAPAAAAMAKALTTEMFRAVAGEAIQVHGGIGFTWEHDLHLFFKRSKYLEYAFGPPAECREVVAAARLRAAR
jgi:alkylation response protein AidB-like acyl-CoA dehydrogenase